MKSLSIFITKLNELLTFMNDAKLFTISISLSQCYLCLFPLLKHSSHYSVSKFSTISPMKDPHIMFFYLNTTHGTSLVNCSFHLFGISVIRFILHNTVPCNCKDH